MSNEMQRLQAELERTLAMLKDFQKSFNGALNPRALSILFANKSKTSVLAVGVRDITGYFYRGEVTAVQADGETFDVVADDGELVTKVPVGRIVAVQMKDKG